MPAPNVFPIQQLQQVNSNHIHFGVGVSVGQLVTIVSSVGGLTHDSLGNYYGSTGNGIIFSAITNSGFASINLAGVGEPGAAFLRVWTGLGAATITATDVGTAGTNILTVTCGNSFAAGDLVILLGTTEAFLNVQTVTVLTASPTQFTANFMHSNYINPSDKGTAIRVSSWRRILDTTAGNGLLANTLLSTTAPYDLVYGWNSSIKFPSSLIDSPSGQVYNAVSTNVRMVETGDVDTETYFSDGWALIPSQSYASPSFGGIQGRGSIAFFTS